MKGPYIVLYPVIKSRKKKSQKLFIFLKAGGKGLFPWNVFVVFYFSFNVFLSFYFTFIPARIIDRAMCSADFSFHASWCVVLIWRAWLFLLLFCFFILFFIFCFLLQSLEKKILKIVAMISNRVNPVGTSLVLFGTVSVFRFLNSNVLY